MEVIRLGTGRKAVEKYGSFDGQTAEELLEDLFGVDWRDFEQRAYQSWWLCETDYFELEVNESDFDTDITVISILGRPSRVYEMAAKAYLKDGYAYIPADKFEEIFC